MRNPISYTSLRAVLVFALLLAPPGCVRPRQLSPPGLAIGAFHVEQHQTNPARTVRGVGLVLQPGRARLGVIRDTTIQLPPDRPAHFRGPAIEAWSLPPALPTHPRKESFDE